MTGVLHISDAANLALHTMIHLASAPVGAQSVKHMAEVLAVSEHHLAKVMQRLGKAGLVRSTRGPRGGFQLAVAPSAVTLLDIYQAVEGSVEVHECLLKSPRCTGDCVLGNLVGQVNKQFREHMAKTRLGDVTKAFGSQDGRKAQGRGD
jgi:Rrf2 family protein